MHKDFRDINKVSPLIEHLEKLIEEKCIDKKEEPDDSDKPLLERKHILELIENQCVLVGKFVPIRELDIKKRLYNFIKKNRVALRYERSCRWQIKNFNASTFLLCEVCNAKQDHFSWKRCIKCNAFNHYQF